MANPEPGRENPSEDGNEAEEQAAADHPWKVWYDHLIGKIGLLHS
jgi:hypothetical protein